MVEINASLNDIDYITNPKRWPDYTELTDIDVATATENTGLLNEEELIANGYQLTDTGWVKV